MSVKLILYCIFIPFCIWVVTSTNIDRIFKKNSNMQINCFYLLISLVLSYLIVNFFIDIYNTTITLW